jgi:toxin ParE1/3/4
VYTGTVAKGHKVPELDENAVRELAYSYRIHYEIKANNRIEVPAVIHKRRHLEPEPGPVPIAGVNVF